MINICGFVSPQLAAGDLLHVFLRSFHSTLDTRPFSLDQLVRPSEHLRRDRQADLLRRFKIDHELELRRLLHWKISRLGALEDFVHVIRDTP
jgi:hypothetical protein